MKQKLDAAFSVALLLILTLAGILDPGRLTDRNWWPGIDEIATCNRGYYGCSVNPVFRISDLPGYPGSDCARFGQVDLTVRH